MQKFGVECNTDPREEHEYEASDAVEAVGDLAWDRWVFRGEPTRLNQEEIWTVECDSGELQHFIVTVERHHEAEAASGDFVVRTVVRRLRNSNLLNDLL